jgi:PAS domain S-box-containing protein
MPEMKRVLLVEDEAVLAMNLEMMLRRLGNVVLPLAASGEDAVALAKEHLPDIVFMDIHLAGEMNGFDATTQIHSFLDVPIVYLTGHSDEATIAEAATTEPYAFLVKPVTQKELMACLEVVQHRHKMDRKLRESEERYRSIVENINDALVIHDFRGKIIDVNDNCCKMFGYTRDELIGVNVALFSSPEALCYQTERITEIQQTPSLVFETRCTGKDGMHIPIEVSARVVSRESTGVTQCFLRDISERKKQEKRIREMNESLEQSIAEKDQLFSIIAHDLRTPLIGLVAFTRMFAEKVDEFSVEDLKKWAGEMKLSAEGLYDLLENLLEWSSLQRGMFRFEPAPLILADIVEQNAGLLRSVTLLKEIVMENHVPDNLIVSADNAMLKTLLRNLLANAFKFSRQGGKVMVFAESDGAMVTVAVRDEGVGMEESVLAGLFKLNRIQSRRGTDGERGTGLGLLLCAELIKRLGGKIWVQSNPGQGTTVYFTLPGGQVTN